MKTRIEMMSSAVFMTLYFFKKFNGPEKQNKAQQSCQNE